MEIKQQKDVYKTMDQVDLRYGDWIAGTQISAPHLNIMPNIVLRNLNFNRSFEMITVSQIWLNVHIFYINFFIL